jgi:signal transduction histidine kinase
MSPKERKSMSEHDDMSQNTPGDDSFEAAQKMLEDSASIMAHIMEVIGDGVSIQDRGMRIVYQNKFMIDNFGSHVGDCCYHIYEKRSTACEGCPIIDSYRTGKETRAMRVGITREGIPFRFENIASVIRNDEGAIVAGIELCRNVEDREKALDSLRESLERQKQTQCQLVRAQKLASIGQLAAGVAHEINNPTMYIMNNLCAVRKYVDEFISYIDWMEKIVEGGAQNKQKTGGIENVLKQIINTEDYRYLRSDLPKAIEESLVGLKRIKTIVASMLEFASSMKSGRCMVDVNEEIQATLLLLDNEIRCKGSVVTKLGDLPETFADPQQLKQMFANLIRNANQAIKPDGTITIATEVKNRYISIGISDNGVGMSEDVIRNLFNPFFTTRDVGAGVGLGLSIAYRIVENHNGNIDVQSELGRGTTFTVRLPITSTDDA